MEMVQKFETYCNDNNNFFHNFAFLFSLFLLTNMFVSSDARPLIRVVVSNQIPGENVTAHCYSSDDDLGTHTLLTPRRSAGVFARTFLAQQNFTAILRRRMVLGTMVFLRVMWS
ncbi:hypothetical protein DH2020_022432 [Rehmannia glutinosa]|uniref:S-protein homolog n=1 Tax=Rehmannia glutinosa TaxID=99300 RepID=A0ABR0WDU4_REHGL